MRDSEGDGRLERSRRDERRKEGRSLLRDSFVDVECARETERL